MEARWTCVLLIARVAHLVELGGGAALLILAHGFVTGALGDAVAAAVIAAQRGGPGKVHLSLARDGLADL